MVDATRRPRKGPCVFVSIAPALPLRDTRTRAKCASRISIPATKMQHSAGAAQRPDTSPGAASSAPSQGSRVAVETEHQASRAVTSFNWEEQWYPVAFECDIVDKTPFAFTLFDTDLVLFRTSLGRYSVLRDRCSHRLAPLSEGRIIVNDSGCAEIECPYHGWQFEGSGACSKIPQNPPGASIPRAAAVRAYPVTAKLGSVFVWFGDPVKADTDLIRLPSHVLAYPESERTVANHFMGVLPYSFETLVENITDPNHVQYAHHGTSNDMNRGYPFGMNVSYTMPTKTHGSGVFSSGWGDFTIEFFPPGLVSYSKLVPGLGRFTMLFYMSPAGHNRARFMLTYVVGESTPLKRFMFKLKPRWLEHLYSLDIFDGDTRVLVGVERALGDPSNWKKEYGPPAGQTDNLLLRFRSWMDENRDAMPWASSDAGASVPVSKREMTDRLKYHTVNCTACTGALRTLETTKKVLSLLQAGAGMGLMSCALFVCLVAGGVLPTTAFHVLTPVGLVLLGCVLMFARTERICNYYVELLTQTDNSKKLYLTAKELKLHA